MGKARSSMLKPRPSLCGKAAPILVHFFCVLPLLSYSSTVKTYGFRHRDFRKLYATALAPNIASMRVLEKCGYQLEGILKGEIQKGGTYFDIHHFARHR